MDIQQSSSEPIHGIQRQDRWRLSTYSRNITNDSISLKSPEKNLGHHPQTQRNVLKELASIYDPLGLDSPILLRGKLFLQTLWSKHLNWDDELSKEELVVWSSISVDLSNILNPQVRRCLSVNAGENNVSYHLVCFCDAYLYRTCDNMETESDLLISCSTQKYDYTMIRTNGCTHRSKVCKIREGTAKTSIRQHRIKGRFSVCVEVKLNSDKELSVFYKEQSQRDIKR